MPESPGEWADRPTPTALSRRHTRSMTITLDTAVAAPSLSSRVAARLGARHLDRLVEAGANPQPRSALEVHVARLTSSAHREHLAAELRRRGTAVLCDRVMSAPR